MSAEMWQTVGALVFFVAVLGAAYTGWVLAPGSEREQRSSADGRKTKS